MSQKQIGTVVSIHRYPIKSMIGEELNATRVGAHGLAGDRMFALTDAETGQVASAKNPKKWPNLFEFHAGFVDRPDERAPRVRITLPNGEQVFTNDDAIDEVLSEHVGRKVCLARSAPAQSSLEEYWPDIEGLARRDEVTVEAMRTETFFDSALVHLLTTATLTELRRLHPGGQIEVRRFRPNLVISTLPELTGFAEGSWVDQVIAIGSEVRLRVTGPCSRCVMTTLPQGDLPKDSAVLRTAAKYNHAEVGAYAAVISGGVIRRGDLAKVEPS
jgi:uncharacterized protein YcbX